MLLTINLPDYMFKKHHLPDDLADKYLARCALKLEQPCEITIKGPRFAVHLNGDKLPMNDSRVTIIDDLFTDMWNDHVDLVEGNYMINTRVESDYLSDGELDDLNSNYVEPEDNTDH